MLHKLLLTVLLAIRNLFMLQFQLQLALSRIDRRRLHVFFFLFLHSHCTIISWPPHFTNICYQQFAFSLATHTALRTLTYTHTPHTQVTSQKTTNVCWLLFFVAHFWYPLAIILFLLALLIPSLSSLLLHNFMFCLFYCFGCVCVSL